MAGTLSLNVMHFARLLRRAGLPVGPADMLAAQQALALIDLSSRPQSRSALRTTMIHRHEHEELFDAAFRMFWRDPNAGQYAAAMALMLLRTVSHSVGSPSVARTSMTT